MEASGRGRKGEGVRVGCGGALGRRREETKESRVVVGVQSMTAEVRPKVLDAICGMSVCSCRSGDGGYRGGWTHELELPDEVVEGGGHGADDAVLAAHEAQQEGELQVAEALGPLEQVFIRHWSWLGVGVPSGCPGAAGHRFRPAAAMDVASLIGELWFAMQDCSCGGTREV